MNESLILVESLVNVVSRNLFRLPAEECSAFDTPTIDAGDFYETGDEYPTSSVVCKAIADNRR